MAFGKVPEGIITKDEYDTSLGKLKFHDGLPDDETIQKVYDNLDRSRAMHAFLDMIPMASIEAMRVGFVEVGCDACHKVILFEKLMDSKSLFLTGNTDTVYVASILNLGTDGPTVIEVPGGFKTAGQVVGLLEVAGRLLASNTKDASTESAAALSSETDDTLVADATSPVQVSLVLSSGLRFFVTASTPDPSQVVFRPLSMDERPSVVIGLLALWLLPIFVSAARFVFNKVYPLMAQRMELPLAALVGVLLIMQVLIWVQQNLENFLSIPATLVFVLYTLIPAISVCLATRSVLQGAHEAPFFALLGVFNLASGYLRWAGDLSDDAALDQQPIPRFAACREQVTRWREWLWIGLLIDFVLEEIMGRVCGLHALRLLGPPITSTQATLVEYRTLAFAVGLVAAQAQARALVLLQRRSVLLRLLGARKAFIGGITLLLMGAFAVVQQPRTMAFLREVSPTPWWCCMVLWLRQFGAIAGALLPLVLYTLVQPQSFGRLSVDTLVPLAVSAGCVAGVALGREHLESDYRVIFLFPHMSSQARQKASAAMRVTLKRGAEATKNTAAEWVATRAVRTGMDFFVRALSRRTALPMD
eukprot:g16075.t1